MSFTGEILTEIIRTNLVTKGLRNVGTAEAPVYEIAYTPVEANAMAVRIMLTEPPDKGGLIGRVPLAAPGELQPVPPPRKSHLR